MAGMPSSLRWPRAVRLRVAGLDRCPMLENGCLAGVRACEPDPDFIGERDGAPCPARNCCVHFGRGQDAILPWLTAVVALVDEEDEPFGEQVAHRSLGCTYLFLKGNVSEHIQRPMKRLRYPLPVLHGGILENLPAEG